ncbi:2-amino-4-hydroxy-6-hydroxymethyldihydropteridine diphosphokinase [Chelatococcus sp. GCM10030263]|uniref:2-amino-4-hydroxy-6- hydroxymethyldihydropteridine diphosphokinase n=1 Tax=Chelatococcus sp. GCM10030263 TaxID=3273387 RepID=UPI00361B579E
MADAYLSLGSNLGDKRAMIARAVERLGAAGVAVIARSSDYRTPPWGDEDQDWFVNACVKVRTDLSPHDLLTLCLAVERDLGRVRTRKWGPRTIDIDLLVYDGVQMASGDLVLPHPRIAERAFVLQPLAEIAPDLEITGRRISAMLQGLDAMGIERLPSRDPPPSS